LSVSPKKSVRSLGQVFDRVAEAYDAYRWGYPSSLVDRTIERGNLRPGSRVLEIGCGTGKLTEALLERGLRIDAVDPGPKMVDVARRRFAGSDLVSFHVGRFEDVELPDQSFDAAFSATAFHWVDPAVGWSKAAAHLKPGGLLALLSYVSVGDEQSSAAQDNFLRLLRRHAPDVAAEWRQPPDLDVLLAGVEERRSNASQVWDWLLQGGLQRPTMAVAEGSLLFDGVDVASETFTFEETPDELHAHFRTTSIYHRIDPARRAAFEDDERRWIERNGGTARFSLAVLLMMARRRPSVGASD
jgi:SAM-dependent methyltransferase